MLSSAVYTPISWLCWLKAVDMTCWTHCAYILDQNLSPNTKKILDLGGKAESKRPKYLINLNPSNGGTYQSILWSLSTCIQVCSHVDVNAYYFLACIAPYLGSTGLNQRYRCIYCSRGTTQSRLWYLCTCMQEFSCTGTLFLACRGPYLNKIVSIQGDGSSYGNRRTHQSQHADLLTCMHTNFPVCTG